MAVNKVVINAQSILDLTADTVTADTMLEGVTAHKRDGTRVIGALTDGDPLYYGNTLAYVDSAIVDTDYVS